ncbi:type IV secretion system DNA-binding domain-containing protein [Henriciella sp.]|uniref:type IV secretory system conjugative DNA transfer family protein n=1 Tax=Henriciella sp. TaxID=1968823 RepID=UPI00260C902E|nr:type IV secretion system DNA-binding domain-containing protein [Henriciella sp.]
MPLHTGARFHSFLHGLLRSKDRAETYSLFCEVVERYESSGLDQPEARQAFIDRVDVSVREDLGLLADSPIARAVARFINRLFDFEQLFLVPALDWEEKRSTTDWWIIRDDLLRQKMLLHDVSETEAVLNELLTDLLKPLAKGAAADQTSDAGTSDIELKCQPLESTSSVAVAVEQMLVALLPENENAQALFPRLTGQLAANLERASSKNPLEGQTSSRSGHTLPTRSRLSTALEIVRAYLGSTPAEDLFAMEATLRIPEWVRFEHMHMLGGTGHGKSQALQYLIGQDLEAVAAGKRSVVVLDSQGDLIQNIAGLQVFGPGGELEDRLVLIDPSDVEWPVALNLFDVGQERLNSYEALERERLTNSILELYEFVLGSLLSAEMTQKQNVIFRYVTRLMLHIPDATIHTLRDLMEPGSETKFATYIAKLPQTARRFFETEFSSREFEQTKKQVMRRLWGILENQTFERMFSHPKSKLDLFAEMNAGKVILINTAKDLLKEQGTEIFGRFFIAMIAQAAQERATLAARKRTPTFVYIDEAADYFDRNMAIILAQARKYKVGMILAHQYLGQLDHRLQEAFGANTSIKFAGGVSSKDARALAPMLQCSAEQIESQPKGSFAASVRGVTAAPVAAHIPFGFLEAKAQMSAADRAGLRDRMRSRYAVHYSDLDETEQAREPDSGDETDHDAGDDDPSGSVDLTPGSNW